MEYYCLGFIIKYTEIYIIRIGEIMMKNPLNILNNEILIFLLIVLSNSFIHTQLSSQTFDTPCVELTWMANTNWFIETEDVRIILDG